MKRKPKGRRGRNPHGPVSKDGADVIGIRVVDLLDACAGTHTTTHDPILMATVYDGDSIQTLAFTLRDAKRLVILALAALAHFNVPLAGQILQEHFVGDSGLRLDRLD